MGLGCYATSVTALKVQVEVNAPKPALFVDLLRCIVCGNVTADDAGGYSEERTEEQILLRTV